MAITKVLVDHNGSNRKNRQRIADAEQELNDLMQGKEPEEDTTPVETKAAVEAEPTDPEERTFKKRYGDLRRHLSEKEKEWEAKLEAAKAQPNHNTILPPKSGLEWVQG